MVTDARQPVLSREKTIRTALIIGTVLCSLIAPHTLVAEEEQPELDDQNNIGFMRDIPEELRRELPMCNEFLDVKWIKEMPTHKNWVGRVVVDIWTGERKKQRELAVVEDYKERYHGRFSIVDITAAKYRGRQFDKLILSADRAIDHFPSEDGCILERGLFIVIKGKGIVVSNEWRGTQKYLERGVTSSFINYSRKRICIVHPDKKRWLFKK